MDSHITLDLGFDENPWAWADFDDEQTERVDVSGAHVTAVLVTLDAARWLPATLEALAKLDTRPTRLVAIDNASKDATRTLLDQAYDEGVLDAVYDGSREFGFGAAVNAALELDTANLQDDADTIGFRAISAQDSQWLWLLHDDATPAPDALYQLLAHVATDESIDLTGPKLLLPRRRHGGQPISEVGVSISGTGRRTASTSCWRSHASSALTWTKSIKGNVISLRNALAFPPVACWCERQSGSSSVVSTRHYRSSETGSSLAGALI